MNDEKPDRKIDDAFIIGVLKAMHPPSEWIFAPEVPLSTGASSAVYNTSSVLADRRIDAFALNLWPSKHYQRVAFEIKVSRSDFLGELHHPEKRTQALFLSNVFWFALAPGIYNPKEDYKYFQGVEGVMEISADYHVTRIVQPRAHNAYPMPHDFIASLLRRVRDTNPYSKVEVIYDEGSPFNYAEPST